MKTIMKSVFLASVCFLSVVAMNNDEKKVKADVLALRPVVRSKSFPALPKSNGQALRTIRSSNNVRASEVAWVEITAGK